MFYGKYGNLSSLEAAKESLLDLEEWVTKEMLDKANSFSDLSGDWYECMRTARMIEGLQAVVIKNGGDLGFSKLPVLYKKDKDKKNFPMQRVRIT